MRPKTASRKALSVVAMCLIFGQAGLAATAKGDEKPGEMPAAVASAVATNCPGAEVDKIDVEVEAGVTVYDIELKGHRGEIEVAEDGTVLDLAVVVALEDLPEAAAAAIKKAAEGHTIREVEKSEVRARIEKAGGKGRVVPLATPELVYEAELVAGGEIEVGADGHLIKAPKPAGKGSARK